VAGYLHFISDRTHASIILFHFIELWYAYTSFISLRSMTTITIELDNDLERKINLLSQQEGRETDCRDFEVLEQGLSENTAS